MFSSMIDIPVATFELTRQVAIGKRLAPSTERELVKISDQNVVELFVC
jgi:hypothetical protein